MNQEKSCETVTKKSIFSGIFSRGYPSPLWMIFNPFMSSNTAFDHVLKMSPKNKLWHYIFFTALYSIAFLSGKITGFSYLFSSEFFSSFIVKIVFFPITLSIMLVPLWLIKKYDSSSLSLNEYWDAIVLSSFYLTGTMIVSILFSVLSYVILTTAGFDSASVFAAIASFAFGLFGYSSMYIASLYSDKIKSIHSLLVLAVSSFISLYAIKLVYAMAYSQQAQEILN